MNRGPNQKGKSRPRTSKRYEGPWGRQLTARKVLEECKEGLQRETKKAASFRKRPSFEFANRKSQIRDFNSYLFFGEVELVVVAAAGLFSIRCA
jgi:hypothetical protein